MNDTDRNAEGGTRNAEQDGGARRFDEWAVVEIMGHQKIAGRVTEATIAGGQFLRVDVPDRAGEIRFTRFYGAGAIYCISPVDKQIAIGMAVAGGGEPVQRYQLEQFARSSQQSMEIDDDPEDRS